MNVHDVAVAEAGWRGVAMAGATNEWLFQLGPDALLACRAKPAPDDAEPARFRALEACAALLRQALTAVASGPGFALVRGFPVDVSESDLKTFVLTLGDMVGTVMPQNPAGENVCEVRDTGADSKTSRGYLSPVALPFHSDSADVLALLCVRTAREGGENALVSSLGVRRILAERHPEHLRTLERGFAYAYPDGRGQHTERIPVFSSEGDVISCRYLRAFIDAVGSLEPAETAALDAMDAVATSPEMALNLRMEPGDFLMVNNYTVLHSRTAFQDHDQIERRRLLLRLWINVTGFRTLNPAVAAQSRRFGAGSRGMR